MKTPFSFKIKIPNSVTKPLSCYHMETTTCIFCICFRHLISFIVSLPIQIDDWRRLDHMVKASLNTFQGLWRKRAEERRTILDWATTDVFGRPKKETDEEALSPGAVVKVALGERFRSVNVYITSIGNRAFRPKSNSQRQKWQQKLCKVLVDVCQGGSSKVNPLAVKKTPNHLSYLKLEIHGSLRFVQKVLEGREIGFVVRIKRQQQRAIIKHYAINLHPKRFGRSPPPGSGNRKILGADYNMPDYDQHKCCGNCLSGCSPVAWAQVFGYYDRCASWYNSIFSPRIYGDSNKIAPKTMTDEVKPFVEDIRKRVKTYCRNGEGLTKSSKMHLIEPWFRARQGAKARAVTYLRRRWFLDLFSFNSRIYKRSASSIISKGKWWLNKGYPVVFGFLTERKNGHAAVATKYRVRSRRYRHCVKLWFITIRCTWKTANDCEFFLHYGWGPNHNRWLQLDSTILSAHVAYITK